MEINEEQLPPTPRPPIPEKGEPKDKPDTGPKPDFVNPEKPEEGQPADDPLPDMGPDGQDGEYDETVN